MTIPEFTDDLVTGSDEVDRQHRMLFEAAHKVLAAQRAGPEAVFKATRFLLSYVRYHFEAEEHAMRASAYPRMDVHILQHGLIRQDVDAIRSAALSREETRLLLARIQAVFQDWILPHIREVDVQFARHLKQQADSGGPRVGLPSPDAMDREGRLPKEFDMVEWKRQSR